MTTMTRFPFGVATAREETLSGGLSFPTPLSHHTFFNDFDTYSSASWTEKFIQGSTLTNSLNITSVNGDGGILAFSLAVTPNNELSITNIQEGFQFDTSKEMFFQVRLNYGNSTGATIKAGLMQASSTAFFTVNGVYFRKDAADTALDFIVASSTASTLTTLNIATMSTLNTTLGYHYKPGGGFDIYVNDVLVRNVTPSFVPLTELSPTLGIQNGSTGAGIAQGMNVDYIFASKPR